MNIVDENLITTDPVPYLSKNGIQASVLRLDKLHPIISGNKWFKLKYYLKEAEEQNRHTIITFGGAYSNHIVAVAEACRIAGFKCSGIIRGEEPETYSPTLKTASQCGMQLKFITRGAYKQKIIPEELKSDGSYIIPEGGFGELGALGAATIPYDKNKFDTICCACGTGAMVAGLINGKTQKQKVIGLSVLKNHTGLEAEIRTLLINKSETLHIIHDFHFGGYAKQTQELIKFMNDLYRDTKIPTDFVYTAKLFYGVRQLIIQNNFKPGTKLLLIHSGGLQGNLSLQKRTLIF